MNEIGTHLDSSQMENRGYTRQDGQIAYRAERV